MKIRVENPELKPQIEAFVIETLENCKLFVDTYGRGFAAKRLATNFKTVFTDELNKKARGQYALGTSGIMTLFMEGIKGNLLTFEDIKNKDDLQTVLHESIHAIFNKTPKECKDAGIRMGSGIHELYEDTELGRGLNEGFTNWVCDKAGFKTMSYPTLTNLINILEMAIGPEKVMQFGKGNITKNISNLLGMTPTDCQTFLSYADQIYNYEDKATDYSNLASILRRKTVFENEKAKTPELTMDDSLAEELQSLQNNFEYTNLLNNLYYMTFVQENNLKPELEGSKLKYFEHQKEFFQGKAKEMDHTIKGEILSKYFMKELGEVVNTGNSTVEQYKRYSKLSNLLYTYGEIKDQTMVTFKENFGILRKQFYDRAENDIKNALKNGTLTPEKITQYRDATFEGNQYDPSDFNTMLAKIMLPENPYAYEALFRTISCQNMIPELFNYRILELEGSKGQKTNLFFDTKNGVHFARYIASPKTFLASSEIEDKEHLFDMTLNELQSIQEIVNNFLMLKDEICQRNPNTHLQIVEGVVVSTEEGKSPSFYVLDGNNWNHAHVTEYVPQNVKTSRASSLQIDSIDTSAIKETEKDKNALDTITKNPFKRFFQELKRRFFKPEPSFAVADSNPIQSTNKMEEDKKRLEDNICFTEDGKPIQTPTIDQTSIQSHRKEVLEKAKEFTD